MDEVRIPASGDPFTAHARPDDTLDTHYASLERLECYCYGSGVVVLTVEEDGEEHDVLVPCKRCKQS